VRHTAARGSFVDVDAEAPPWPAPTTPDHELWRDHPPRTAPNWFVVADGRGRVNWTFTGDELTTLHVLVCRATPSGYLQRLRDLGVGYFVVGDRHVDLRAALARIRRVLEADRVIIDSGGTMNAALLRLGLVDILDVVTLPGLVGGAETPRSWTARRWATMSGRFGCSYSIPSSSAAVCTAGTAC